MDYEKIKTDWAKRREKIKADYAKGDRTLKQLSEQYHVSVGRIHHIVKPPAK